MSNRSTEREQFLADIIIGAVEGGTGYWASVSEYEHPVDAAATFALLHEEDPDGTMRGRWGATYSSTPLRLDPDGVAGAIVKITRDRRVSMRQDIRERIARAYGSYDASDLDADDCDVIAQVALLGSIVYG